MDKLEAIFARQRALDEFLVRARDISFDLPTWLEKEVLALLAELGELLQELNFRWWKDPRPLNREAIKEEVVDLLHFLVSLCLKLEIGPQELYEAYLAKNEENLRRQQGLSHREGYAAPRREQV
ncbi:MAG: dUTP diphosphatase [Clostridia bacterium]|jgi:dimeric dUTPase (all-alpha-NTP-PPase superfamily)|nr:dUTPase [Clostridia bacterium]MDH7572370.1 dUTP diphosphatase [Clostridia bacterium]